ncbi:hypothetical protein D7294_14615 [Streptomyces hoynatensis]|uniref:WD40 repeat domain-containing protein n=1 Tax=Streptomyces hoynatensis TaxID=1141874 RepID=A0A3A9Z1G7_9ACTN|nr:hypothetical protein D7294_14615 [Streptomyces hoynatensis]
MGRAARLLAAPLLALAALACLPAGAAADEEPEAFTMADPRIVESSGLAASLRHPGVYWTHNDSDDAARLFAVDGATGETVATVTLSGVQARDVEAVSLGPDGDLYVGDIGDNYDGAWSEVWIYRLPEPAELADATVTPTVYTVQYADGPRDAEALMVHPVTGRVYLVSKKQDGGAKLYAGPERLSESGVNTFEPVADIGLWVTDGAFSPDGTRLLLRGYFTAQMYRWEDGTPQELSRRVIPPLQAQGESVTFTADGRTLMFGSEGEASAVEPVPLAGELLPDSVARQDAAEDGGGAGPDAGSEAGDAADGDRDGARISTRTALTLVLAAVVVLGLRRLFSRRGQGG